MDKEHFFLSFFFSLSSCVFKKGKTSFFLWRHKNYSTDRRNMPLWGGGGASLNVALANNAAAFPFGAVKHVVGRRRRRRRRRDDVPRTKKSRAFFAFVLDTDDDDAFLTEEEEEDDDDAHPSSETSMRLWGEAGEEEDNTNTNTNTNRGAEGIARSRAGFSATGSPRTKMMIPGNKTGRRRRPERRLC